jgi:hypothetical protein
MNTFSFIFGGMFGILAAWVFFSASIKSRRAHEQMEKLKKIEKEIDEKKREAKAGQIRSRSETRQSFFLYFLAFIITLFGGAILFVS